MSTFLKLLPLELQSVEKYTEPRMEIDAKDHIVGDMTDDHKKLWTLFHQMEYDAAELSLKHQYGENIDTAKIMELNHKGAIIKAIFWTAINDEFQIWDKQNVGVRRGYKVVWTEIDHRQIPPFIGRIFGFEQ